MYPKKLQAGDVIGLVAPSSPVEKERALRCIAVLEQLGFKVKAADNLWTSKGGYMAGDEKKRAQWLNAMFADDEVDAVFCLRGGDGANRILEYLDLELIGKHPKIFVGYSDITCIHVLLNQVCGLVTFHGPMVSSNMLDKFDEESKAAFFEALTAESVYRYREPAGMPMGIARSGRAKGILTGGNLTLISTSIGTPGEADTDGRILFLEEVGAHVGNLDRCVYHLRNAGKLSKVKGIILGQFTNCETEEASYDAVQIIKEAAEGLDIPIIYDVQSGHGQPMITLPLGAECIIDTEKRLIEFPIGPRP